VRAASSARSASNALKLGSLMYVRPRVSHVPSAFLPLSTEFQSLTISATSSCPLDLSA